MTSRSKDSARSDGKSRTNRLKLLLSPCLATTFLMRRFDCLVHISILLKCQYGELRMDKNGVTLETDGTKLSFPINAQNYLPLALPIPMVIGFTIFNFSDKRICLGVADKTNQNATGPQKELLEWHWKFGHTGFKWIQLLMKPRHPR
jgi:hypothetical protein